MDPINYSALQVNPLASFNTGLQTGVNLENLAIQRQQAQQAQALQQQKQQAALLFQRAVLNPNSTAVDFNAALTLDPSLREPIKDAYSRQTEQQQNAFKSSLVKFGSALSTGNADVASAMLDEQVNALKNSNGDPAQIKQYETIKEIAKQSPDIALGMVKALAIGLPDGDKIVNSFGAIQKQRQEQQQFPIEQAKLTGEALTAQAKGIRAPELVQAELGKLLTEAEVAKENVRIKAMEAGLARETNDLKRQELQLKIDEAKNKIATGERDKAAALEGARSNIDNMLNTADRVLQNPALNSVLGSIQGRMDAYLSDDAADAIALIDTLKSQSFLSQIPQIKGLGALSNAEGEKLQSALTNLDRKQSEGQFRANLKEAQRLVLKARDNLAKQYGVTDTAPDRPNVPTPDALRQAQPITQRSYYNLGQ